MDINFNQDNQFKISKSFFKLIKLISKTAEKSSDKDLKVLFLNVKEQSTKNTLSVMCKRYIV